MKHLLVWLSCGIALASTAAAQLSNYLGPGILTNGAGNIGNRSGEQVDLRFYVDVNGVYDNGLQTLSVDSKGNLVQAGGLYGIEAVVGAYGTHAWSTSLLGLDYRGDFRHYTSDSFYDGSDQFLSVGYTLQKSRRLYFELRGTGASYSNYLGAVPGDSVLSSTTSSPTYINPAAAQIFDSRANMLQGTASMTYMFTPRMSLTVAGNGFWIGYQSSQLTGTEGYGGNANLRYRVSRTSSVGLGYSRQHYQYPGTFGDSNYNSYTLYYSQQMGRLWTFTMEGGVYNVDVVGLESIPLAPALAALLGTSSSIQVSRTSNWLPSGSASLSRKFKTANLNFAFTEGAAPGNGVYLASRQNRGTASYSYTGVRKMSFSITGGYWSVSALGQSIPPYRAYTGSLGLTYNLTKAVNAVARYDAREQAINIAGYRATSYRVTLGLAFSPGTLPLSLW